MSTIPCLHKSLALMLESPWIGWYNTANQLEGFRAFQGMLMAPPPSLCDLHGFKTVVDLPSIAKNRWRSPISRFLYHVSWKNGSQDPSLIQVFLVLSSCSIPNPKSRPKWRGAPGEKNPEPALRGTWHWGKPPKKTTGGNTAHTLW